MGFMQILVMFLYSKAETTEPKDEKGRRERERRLWFSVEKAKNLDARHGCQMATAKFLD